MSPTEAVSGTDELLHFLTDIDQPFGGKVVVFCWDFRQALPVRPGASRAEIVEHTLNNHAYWKQGMIQVLTLQGNARAERSGDASYAAFLR
eukprot:10873185-Karenia_brevis.AAC.1